MTSMPQPIRADTARPQLSDPASVQVAALCRRAGPDGPEVLLVTSSNDNWIVPKGWPIDGLTLAQAAAQEAWEEAGVIEGPQTPVPLGRFQGSKRFDDGAVVSCDMHVFAIDDVRLADDFPETDKRNRRWVSVADAPGLIDDPDLRDFMLTLPA